MRKSAASNDVVTVMQCWPCDNMRNYPGLRVRITKDLFNKQLNELYSTGSDKQKHSICKTKTRYIELD